MTLPTEAFRDFDTGAKTDPAEHSQAMNEVLAMWHGLKKEADPHPERSPGYRPGLYLNLPCHEPYDRRPANGAYTCRNGRSPLDGPYKR